MCLILDSLGPVSFFELKLHDEHLEREPATLCTLRQALVITKLLIICVRRISFGCSVRYNGSPCTLHIVTIQIYYCRIVSV